jgi:tripartite-type tricarboxylate transporter receptor subunit TctC
MTMLRVAVLASCFLAGTWLAAPAASAADPSLAGKTVRIVVNQSTGGPTDTFARHFTRFWEAHIPGHPAVVVENQSGAAGMVAANAVYNVAKPDGLVIGFMASITNDGLLGGPSVKFDLTKFGLLAAIPSTQVTLIRHETGASAPRDLLHPKQPLIYAGYGGWVGVAGRLFFDMIGAPYKYITGYDGQAGTMLAIRQGEATAADAGAALYMPNADAWRREGLFDAIAQRGELGEDGTFHRSPMLPHLPTVAEAIAELNPSALKTPRFSAYHHTVGANLGQYLVILPPGTDPDTFRVLARATAEAFRDPQAIASAKDKLHLEYNFMDSAQATRFVEQLKRDLEADPAGAEVMRTMIRQ